MFSLKLCLIAVMVHHITSLQVITRNDELEDKNFWDYKGRQTMEKIINKKIQNYHPKNVIIFVGDGMGVSTVTAMRIFGGQLKGRHGEENVLSFEEFSNVGLSKTYSEDKQVPDSASTATAMFSGVKTNFYTTGFDMTAQFNVCNAVNNKKAEIPSMMTWAQNVGKETGIVTTTRITHATPAATFAHINHRDWECDTEVPDLYKECTKDIARQLVEDEPGSKFKVILGGGMRQLGIYDEDASDDSCSRADGMNLTKVWMEKRSKGKFVRTAAELEAVNTAETEHLMGLFAPGHLSYVGERVASRPSLSLMTTKAIEILQKNPNGFLLMVEGGRIDQAHHKNYAHLALLEGIEFEQSIQAAMNLTDFEDTLILVTADHSHGFVINGYPNRGNDILGLAKNDDKLFYETLSYITGPGFKDHKIEGSLQGSQNNCKGNCSKVEVESANYWRDLRQDKDRLNDVHYRSRASVYVKDAAHSGEDVAVYAHGPLSHLIEGVFEQSYIGHVISYALCSGPEAYRCRDHRFRFWGSSSSPATTPSSIIVTLVIVYLSRLFS